MTEDEVGVARVGKRQKGEGQEGGLVSGKIGDDIRVVDCQPGELGRGDVVFCQAGEVFPLDWVGDWQDWGEG